MTEFDASQINARDQYKLLIGSVTPRPIAFVSTLGKHGPNAAPFSFFNIVGSNPAMLMISVSDGEYGMKDTVTNIRECPEFVVHIVSDAIKDKMNVCATEYPIGINEIVEAGLTALPSRKVRPLRIAEAPVAFECKLLQMLELGRSPWYMIIGEVVYFHFHDGIVDERFHVDVEKINPIGRLGNTGSYARTTDRFEMPRIKYTRGTSRT